MNHAFQIHLRQEQKEFHLQVIGSVMLEQLHQAIMILYQWEDKGSYHFSFQDQNITSRVMSDQTIDLLLEDHTSFQYTYSHDGKNEWIHIEAIKTSETLDRPIQLADAHRRMVDFHELQERLDALASDEILEQTIAELLEKIRCDLTPRKTIAPYLIRSKQDTRSAVFYLDVLDNGMELMVFADENDFTRSILNSMNEDPDLLFTNAYTFDFLYDDINHSELPIYHHHNLCFKNEPGQLPRALYEEEKPLVVALLADFYHILKLTPHLPSFGDKQVLQANDDTIRIDDFQVIGNSIHTEVLKKNDIPAYPHTNEQIHLILQAVPHQHEMTVRLTAINDHFTKTAAVHMYPLSTLQQEIDEFLLQLFKERGIAEAFILHSLNLRNMVAPICERLGITCMGYRQPSGADLFMAHLLAQAFPMPNEELYYHPNTYTGSEHKMFS